jgi:uncharacterized protein (DUF1778 family)
MKRNLALTLEKLRKSARNKQVFLFVLFYLLILLLFVNYLTDNQTHAKFVSLISGAESSAAVAKFDVEIESDLAADNQNLLELASDIEQQEINFMVRNKSEAAINVKINGVIIDSTTEEQVNYQIAPTDQDFNLGIGEEKQVIVLFQGAATFLTNDTIQDMVLNITLMQIN